MRLLLSLFVSIITLQSIIPMHADAKGKSQNSNSIIFPWFEDQFDQSDSHEVDMVDEFDD